MASALVLVQQPAVAAEKIEFVRFPDTFKWCVATSGHQIEGNNVNSDWWRWEHSKGKIINGEMSGWATDHWNRVEEDAQLISDLNVGYYRMSVEWSRLEPRPGVFSNKALEHYRHELKELLQRGIQPMVTLNHFTLPIWVADRGGWEWDGMPEAFARYAEFVYRGLGHDVQDWITINEPMVVAAFGYIGGTFPPGKTNDGAAAVRAVEKMLRSHALAYHLLHRLAAMEKRAIRVGVAHHFRIFDPKRPLPADWLMSWVISGAFNWAFPDALKTGTLRLLIPQVVLKSFEGLKGTQDFIGVNYYTRNRVDFSSLKHTEDFQLVGEGHATTDVGWEIYPEGIYRILKSVAKRYRGLPILVTENGLADGADIRRLEFLKDHLFQLSRAVREGVPLEGYCYWSLLDNFEWTEGFEPRFGLYEVDYRTFERIPRLSARFFAHVARTGHFWYPNQSEIQLASNRSSSVPSFNALP
ncbi:MAG: family 1 glycosylhydrolase [Pseudomonadota bacterium]